MLHSHDMYYEKDLSFLLNFLGDEEISVLVKKLSVRINIFRSEGTLSFDSNVLEDSPEAGRDLVKKDFQMFENLNDSDEEIETLFEKSESGRCSDDKEQIREIGNIFLGDSDDEVAEDQKNVEDDQSERPGNDNHYILAEEIGETVVDFEDQQKKKIESLLFSDEESDGNSEENFTEEDELAEESQMFVAAEEEAVDENLENVSTMKLEEQDPIVDEVQEEINEDPLKYKNDTVNLKDEIDSTPTLKLEERAILLLDNEDEEEEQTAGSNIELSTEGDKSAEISSGKFDHINLVLSFKSRNYCRLCYDSCGNAENLRKHEELKHPDEKETLERTFLSVKDLKYKCNFCPQIPGFLTENLVFYHMRKDHKGKKIAQNKKQKVTCHLCQKQFQSRSIKTHLETHNTELNHECNLCYKKFKMTKYLTIHQRKYHAEQRQYFGKKIDPSLLSHSCSECDLKFLAESALQYHIRENHSDSNHKAKARTIVTFQCKLCYRKLKTNSNYKTHIKVHKEDLEALNRDISDDELKHSCHTCDLKFYSRHVLTYHSLLNHCARKVTNKRYQCTLCYENFTQHENVIRHCKNFHPEDLHLLSSKIEYEQDFQCEQCSKKFRSSNILRLHVSKNHGGSTSNKQVRKNKKPIMKRKAYCNLCYVNFKYNSKFKKHVEKVHKNDQEFLERDLTDEDLKFPCVKCDKKFVKEAILRNHLAFHKQVESAWTRKYYKNKRYTCNLCYCNYRDSSALVKHFSKIHAGEEALLEAEIIEDAREFSCQVCQLRFIKESHLNYHLQRKHTGGKLKLKVEISGNNCKLCSVKFKQERNFRLHVIKVHAKELEAFDKELKESDLSHGCGQCEKRFFSNNSLQYHETRVHRKKHHKKGDMKTNLGEPLVCSLCYKTFMSSQKLKKHQAALHKADQDLLGRKIELEELQYSCTVCDKSFARVHILKYHMRSQHADQSEGYCKLCQVVIMKGNAGLQNHKRRVHPGVSDWDSALSSESFKFPCDCCEKVFLTECSAVFHRFILHSGVGGTSCNLCQTDFKNKLNLKRHKETIHTSLQEMKAFGIKQNEDDLSNPCNSCDKKFLTENILNYHLNYTHKMEKRREELLCQVCDVSWPWTSNRLSLVRSHMEDVHGVTENKSEAPAKNETLENFLNILNSL